MIYKLDERRKYELASVKYNPFLLIEIMNMCIDQL